MTWSTLLRSDWHTQPWKNGGGVTHELLRADDEQGMQWRLSIAEVASHGPFSLFEGVDRVILMLQGQGFRLNFADGRQHTIAGLAEPFAFAGEAPLNCTLLNGPVLDFNVMCRRADFRAQVQSFSSNHLVLPSSALKQFLFVVQGEVTALLGAETVRLSALEALHWQAPADAISVQAGPKSLAVIVTISANP